MSLIRRMRSKGKSQIMQHEEKKTANVGTDGSGMAYREQGMQELKGLRSEMPNSRHEVTQELDIGRR